MILNVSVSDELGTGAVFLFQCSLVYMCNKQKKEKETRERNMTFFLFPDSADTLWFIFMTNQYY